jgi:predicted N-acetyltransferase YhbS
MSRTADAAGALLGSHRPSRVVAGTGDTVGHVQLDRVKLDLARVMFRPGCARLAVNPHLRWP